jgi:hypothetical protein
MRCDGGEELLATIFLAAPVGIAPDDSGMRSGLMIGAHRSDTGLFDEFGLATKA